MGLELKKHRDQGHHETCREGL